MSSLTPNYGFILPGVGDPTDQDLWGGYLNDNFSELDTLIKTVQDLAVGATGAQTGNFSVTSADNNTIFLVDATSGNITVSLADVTTLPDGFKFGIKKVDASANTITIDPSASQAIDGALTLVTSDENIGYLIVGDQTEWFSYSKYYVPPTAPTATRFVSAEQSINPASVVTVAHGLGSAPVVITAYMICKTAEFGYVVDDKIIAPTIDISNTAADYNIMAGGNATDVFFVTGDNGVIVAQKTSSGGAPIGAGQIITPANWRVILVAET